MDKALQEKLFHRFQYLFRVINPTPGTITCNKIECGNGWFDLIWQVCNKIAKVLATESKKFQTEFAIVQIKEKFGRLTIYTNKHNDKIDKLINKASADSFKICEICGKPGKLRKNFIQQTLCDDCN